MTGSFAVSPPGSYIPESVQGDRWPTKLSFFLCARSFTGQTGKKSQKELLICGILGGEAPQDWRGISNLLFTFSQNKTGF